MSQADVLTKPLLINKKIIVGITGGIAAYKSVELIRRLRDQGAEVRVVMTSAAEAFITPLTLQAISGNPVHQSLLDPAAEAGMGHIELARWADLILVAPASADFIARIAHGFANDLLSTLCLASRCAIALAPSMNQAMWHNPITQANLAKITTYSHVLIWGPAAGEQACGDVGFGRMLEANDLAQRSGDWLKPCERRLAGCCVVITAGPTREAIDPVRYLSNQSSGKMGYALAAAAYRAGARVILISGPTQLQVPMGVEIVHCISALDMHAASLKAATDADIFIAAAAVADFRPRDAATQKLKKGSDDTMQLTLIKNPDIVASIAALTLKPWVVGFAAETHNLETYAKKKLIEKKLDMIVANDVSHQNIGFNSNDNAVSVISQLGTIKLELASKNNIAEQLITLIIEQRASISAQ
ncbi:MAG: bifunctional phosphopantothenoylcysteine decarboxylase/phosphopantothenate--cysteine ligase CoaBC [Marinagarivorans sp.]|nr:bifunctional phosphopantothenoylcysteine decarboxylase/phosphopantothenate--cysteine ligase CoaBC [Marinagarivorans sp.]